MIVDKVPELLCHVDFPVYLCHMVSPRHLLLGGGGGPAKTGVKNGFEILEISHDGQKCIADSICRFDTETFAIMNATASAFDPVAQKTLIAVGKNGHSQIYELLLSSNHSKANAESEEGEEDNNGGSLRKRSTANGGIPRQKKEEFLPLTFKVVPLQSFQTDFSLPEPYQKVVKFSPDMKCYSKIHEIKAHDKEIDDIDFSPDSLKVVTVSKDQRALVWDVKKGKKHAEMSWKSPNKKVNPFFSSTLGTKDLPLRIVCAK
ncbi:PREB [Lepeophtheirus salmonis]|uniref:PREB n=1 Tax=Lepeophtheirus salmonis TaxID=72036 RepID=A0A7R8CNZ5_LEPSM|nr:PREB [Lepeophtheirus salmonis]CAF2881147.1 PREB [Lepeophtheirus salmonis]